MGKEGGNDREGFLLIISFKFLCCICFCSYCAEFGETGSFKKRQQLNTSCRICCIFFLSFNVQCQVICQVKALTIFLPLFMQSGTKWSCGRSAPPVPPPEADPQHCCGECSDCCSQSARPQPQRSGGQKDIHASQYLLCLFEN